MPHWTDDQRHDFLTQQFAAQDHAYHAQRPGADYLIITLDDSPVGRFYRHEQGPEWRVMDITLLPQHRGGGLGGHILSHWLEEADRQGVPVTLHVEPFNPALRLYTRLGFLPVEERGVYWFMRRPVHTLLPG
ncbi:hypothetical protein GCM10010844_00300 [Deinococcus radiotolerans]|uniref:N-acetyltransferase domain-containing protein n=1 Tax=Deinococcus radiotolerans TaxID=1309407 RepID=A0ABQ2FCR7_9DEIO|nr:hypothetical protein GCM10010844_00300 [Deinococcus radiotolerans]